MTGCRRIGIAALLVCAAGCARGGYRIAGDAAAGDAAASDRALRDAAGAHDSAAAEARARDGAAADAGSANPLLGAFAVSAPERLVALCSAAEDGEPHLAPDGLTLYFASNRAPGWDVYRATRPGPDAPFGAPTPCPELNTDATETHFSLARDGWQAFLATERPGGRGLSDIWRAARSDPPQPFPPGSFSPELRINTAGNEHDPEPSADGLRLYYVTDAWPGGSGGQDLMVASRPSAAAPFGLQREVAGVNSPHDEDNPTLTADELAIVFCSSRPAGLGRRDVYYAVRSARDAEFGTPRPLPGLNTEFDEGETHISGDGRELFFSSDRPGGSGRLDLYRVVISARR